MQSPDLRGDRDLDRDEETERDRFLKSATSVSEKSLIVMAFPNSCVATYMKKKKNYTRSCQPTQPITCANHGNHVQIIMISS